MRERAANEFGCNEADIKVESIGGNSYRATGCGQEAEFTCRSRSEYTGASGNSIPCVHDEPAEAHDDTAAPRSRAAERGATEHGADGHPAGKKPPAGAGGFAFGAAPDTVQGKCESAGHQYQSADDGVGTCDGSPVDLGAPTTATLQYCEGHLCRISLVLHPEGAKLTDSLAAVEQALVGKYGPATDNEVAVPTDCTAKLAECIQDGSAQVEMEWDFPEGDSIKLEVPKPKQEGAGPSINVAYTARDVWKKKKPSLGAGL